MLALLKFRKNTDINLNCGVLHFCDIAMIASGEFMPEISRFLGILIKMFWNEHNPPHFHAEYGKYHVEIDIKNLAILNGYLPPRVLGIVVEWAELHQHELMANWASMRHDAKYDKIEPLV